jgi:D-alanine-D-alanine ligase-like ATP-grasp enzyme
MTREYHYPSVSRRLLRLFRQGRLTEVEAVEVEPEYGYIAKITYRNGAVRVTKAGDVGLNSSAASKVALDKAYTKFLLEQAGFSCPRGTAFLLPWWAEQIRPGLAARGFDTLTDTRLLPEYVRTHMGFPVYLKPGDSMRGLGIWLCHDEEQIAQVLDEYQRERVQLALVEEVVSFPDHRLVVLDGRVVLAYSRTPLAVTGDGIASIEELIADLRTSLEAGGREIRWDLHHDQIQARLRRHHRKITDVPRPGEIVPLLDISNLSAGGSVQDLTGLVAARWRELAIEAAGCLGLNFCGVDLACPDLRDSLGDYAIFELNAAPQLDHYGAIGPAQDAIVEDLYATIFNTAPAKP